MLNLCIFGGGGEHNLLEGTHPTAPYADKSLTCIRPQIYPWAHVRGKPANNNGPRYKFTMRK